jgi:hypothetical protein
MREGPVRLAAEPLQDGQDGIDVALPAEDVEVLGVPLDSRVARERVGAPHEVRAARVVERLHATAVESEGRGVEVLGTECVAEVRRRENHPGVILSDTACLWSLFAYN